MFKGYVIRKVEKDCQENASNILDESFLFLSQNVCRSWSLSSYRLLSGDDWEKPHIRSHQFPDVFIVTGPSSKPSSGLPPIHPNSISSNATKQLGKKKKKPPVTQETLRILQLFTKSNTGEIPMTFLTWEII